MDSDAHEELTRYYDETTVRIIQESSVGWVLVLTVLFSVIILPVVVMILPYLYFEFAVNLPYLPMLIVFPFLPAFLMGTIAVWTAVR